MFDFANLAKFAEHISKDPFRAYDWDLKTLEITYFNNRNQIQYFCKLQRDMQNHMQLI